MVASALAYVLWYGGLADVSGSAAAVHTGLMPVAAVLLAAMFLGEALEMRHAAAVALVLAALAVIATAARRRAV
ncbi:MAG: EamA family transporter [Rhodospirillales bacterium]|nr:EamA family transporter [Rhodospirillales bacterium]